MKINDTSGKKYLEYMEHKSKSFQGGLKLLHDTPKTMHAFENSQNPDHCLVHIYKKYLAKRPSYDPKCSKDLYLHPLAKPANPHVWYSCQPLGVGTLSKVIAKLCDVAGMHSKYSNHSLRSTTATHIYDQNIYKQQITEITGHKSVAVRKYKRTSMEMQQQMSDVLYGKPKRKPTSTVSTPPPETSFDLGVNSQMEPTKKESNLENPVQVNITVPKVEINTPVINIQAPKITVNPVINLQSEELIYRNDG